MDQISVLCLITVTRGGSKLFHSFLDGHPQVLCFPRTLQFNVFWNKISFYRCQPDRVVQTFVETHPRFFSGKEWHRYNRFDRANQLGPSRDETFWVDPQAFHAHAIRCIGNCYTRKNWFIALHMAYHFASGRKLKKNPLILYHIHDLEYINDLAACIDDFGKPFVLVTLRHPVQGLRSCLRWMIMHNTLSCEEIYHHFKQALFSTDEIMKKFPTLNIRILPYEQLNTKHHQVMQAVTSWTGLDWHENLMKSTIHNKLWWGNGVSPRNGPDQKYNIPQPRHWLEKKDWFMMECLVADKLEKWAYGFHFNKRGGMRINRIKLLLPLFIEWATLKKFFSFSYLIEGLLNIKNAQLIQWDYYNKSPVTKNKHVLIHLLRRFVYRINPMSWLYYYTCRVICTFRFQMSEKNERSLPNLLLGE